MNQVRHDGFYRSAPIAFDEHHGGSHWQGTCVQFWRFLPNGRFLRCISENHVLDFWLATEAQTDLVEGLPLMERISGGTYEQRDEVLTAFDTRVVDFVDPPKYVWHVRPQVLDPKSEVRACFELVYTMP
jgi:hypothetical protein